MSALDFPAIAAALGMRGTCTSIPADWAEGEVYRRLCALPTVAEIGYW